MSKKSGLMKFVAGAAVGAGVALLFAPQKGSKTREDLKKKLDELVKKAKDVDVEKMVDDIKNELKDLDREKVTSLAKEKANQIVKKADELVKIAKKKAEPAVESAALEVKIKAKQVLTDLAEKIEVEPKKNVKSNTKKNNSK